MALTLWLVSLLVAGLTLADQLRRSPSDWIAADRERGTWVTSTVVGGVLFLGPIAAIAYAIAVLPRFVQVHDAREDLQRTPPPPAPPVRAHVAPARLWSGSVPPATAHEPMPEAPPRRKLVIEIDDV